MPLIDIHVMEGVFSQEEKARIIAETAKGFGRVAGQAMQANTSVRVHEVRSGDWGGAEGVWTTERALALKAEG
ncbi:4-oxalocrotonate tautomerase [Pseudooceanicola antarcticus]|uniref:4-oxalocrotonate tautomerase n=1 Tax=Pseudooceanicola antarcticus TaxID=1247613 RepID=A0A285J7A4_9RHOB|nr:tautomerase family protein [Pseudooceanicola antarcticus]PJE27108.1 4-oxalocrotonate tautomerase [Pseudooceanicola antarcticus]SNY55933.1 4-oxalocrotonate tautomerase [Pseudooceanicola antarcticus]